MTTLLFILLLIVSFVVLLYLLRPTTTETAVQRHLENIGENRSVEGDDTTIPMTSLSMVPDWTVPAACGIGGSGGTHSWQGMAGK
jgi:hypothetical protein